MTPEQFIVFTASPGESLFQEEGVGGATLEATQGATTDNQPQPEPSQYHKTQTTTLVLMLVARKIWKAMMKMLLML